MPTFLLNMLQIKVFILCVTLAVVTCKDFVYEFGPYLPEYVRLGKTEGQIYPLYTTTTVNLSPMAAPEQIGHVKVTVSGWTGLDTPTSVDYDFKSGVVTIYYSLVGSVVLPRHYVIEFHGIVHKLTNKAPKGLPIVVHFNSKQI